MQGLRASLQETSYKNSWFLRYIRKNYVACRSLSSAVTLVLRSEVDDSILPESPLKHKDEQ